ncbi:hypothetical protein EIP86_001279, partial [Pleurotus ostreatoroseus]
MGANIVAANGEQWRKHRKVTAPAFDNQIYYDVWAVTTRMYEQMLDSEAWKFGDQHYFKSFNTFTTRMALLVITTCGFNMQIPWEGYLKQDGLAEPVDTNIVTVADSLLLRLVLPKWVYKFPIARSYADLVKFLRGEVSLKQAELAEQKAFGGLDTSNKNLFTRVVMSSIQEGTKGLNEDDIIGNLFIYLFAGHETTATAMVTTLALLAISQQEQDRIHKYIMDTVGLRDLSYEDYNELLPVLHCFYEALRLYPPAPVTVRMNKESASLKAPGIIPEGDTLVLPPNVEVIVDVIAAGLNSRIFDNPSAFQPLRWAAYDVSADDLLTFSYGPRGCLGRKFGTVEGVCFLTHLLREWKFDIKLEDNETPLEWQERNMKPSFEVTMRV